MPTWSQQDVRKHMRVYSSDDKELGQVEDVYEDSFKLHKGILPVGNRYIPYSTIGSIENERIRLLMTEGEEQQQKWTMRPNYEAHKGDPEQLLYDRGHGVHDPFDEENPTKPQ